MLGYVLAVAAEVLEMKKIVGSLAARPASKEALGCKLGALVLGGVKAVVNVT
jgi:hypothetical protein